MKRIIICCDGTWNTPDTGEKGASCASNVARMAELIAPAGADGIPQLTYYHDGVGTGDLGDKIVGGAFGVGISKNITDCYRFIVMNYVAGDQLWFFGFSRGAYTARSIIGLIRNSGLLTKQHLDKLPRAYDLYRDRTDSTHPNSQQAKEFRTEFSYPDDVVRIHFLGVWDTVGSLGVPGFILKKLLDQNWEFHDVTLSSIINTACHAVAIDERRTDFKPCLWNASDRTISEQVWFPGVHGDVGGGYSETALSDCALAWMLCKAEGCGLTVDRNNVAVQPDYTGTLHDSMKLFFRPRGKFVRQAGTDPVSRSAMNRYGAAPDSRPEGWPAAAQLEPCAGGCGKVERCF